MPLPEKIPAGTIIEKVSDLPKPDTDDGGAAEAPPVDEPEDKP